MRYVPLGDTFYFKFTTRDFDTGAPQTLGGTPVISAYEDANLTQITAGITLTVDYDSVTGLNHVAVVATGANGYEDGKYYAFVITTGTVDGVSVVGETVHEIVIGSAPADVIEISGSSTAADNAEVVFDTDFATNYNATRNAWVTNAQDFVGTTGSDPFNGQVVAASVTGAVGSVTSGVSLANGAITNASLAGNMEIVFETDFATNYNTTRNAWATNLQDTVGTGNITADVIAISGDTTAADNCELFFDDTGFNASNSTIGTCTTNTDMRGTDSALLASSAPTNFGDLAITVTTGEVTVGTNNDKTGYSISGTKTTLDDLNDVSTADVNTQCDTALSDIGLDHLVSASVTGTDITDNSIIAKIVSSSATADWDDFVNTDDSLQAISESGGGGPTAAQIADAVLDEALSGHTTDGTLGAVATELDTGGDLNNKITLIFVETV